MEEPFLDPTPLEDLPPHSDEAEMGLLGCILQDPSACLNEIVELGTEPVHFFDLRNRAIYSAILELYTNARPVDYIALIQTQALKNAKVFDEAGPIGYIPKLQESASSASNYSYYVEIVKEKRAARMAIQHCSKLITRIKSGQSVPESIASLELELMNLGTENQRKGVKTTREIAKEISDVIQRKMSGEVIGIQTGFHALDKATDGLAPQDMWVIAGRPSCGKTTIAVNIGEMIADRWKSENVKKSVVLFSMEMSSKSIGIRMTAGHSGVCFRSVRPGISEGDVKKLITALGRLAKLEHHFIIDDTPGLTIARLMAKCRHYKRRNNAGLIIVDYLQLVTDDGSDPQRREFIDRVSRTMKQIAKELDIPVIALAQLNRDVEKETKRKPRMSDLRESGGIEQDADFIGILYNPNNGEEKQSHEPRQINLRVCKQRNGGKEMDVPFMFKPDITKFHDMAVDEEI